MTAAGEKLIAAARQAVQWSKSDAHSHSCNCIGPQPGQPDCPCMMRSVTIENGRYVRRVDLGPAPGVTA